MDLFEYRDGRLWCEGVAAEDLAARFGTPLYVYSRGTLEAHYDRLAAAFAALSPMICYSVKSCGNLSVLRVLASRGAGMDVVSGGELERAHAAGCPMDRIVYAGVGKGDAEIRAALDGRHALGSPAGLGGARVGAGPAADRGPIAYFNIESEPEFENVASIARALGVPARAALRVNPDVDPRTHVYTSTGKKETKFGVDLERALEFFRRYGDDPFLRLDALHIHLGSPIYETGPYVEGVRRVLGLADELAGRGRRIAAIDVGGGFGADYETDRSPAMSAYAEAIVPLLEPRVRGGLRVILEPGRTIVANAGVLLTRAQYVKQGGSRRFIICDAGMQTLIRPALYGSFHFIWPARPGADRVPPRRTERPQMPGLTPADIVGPICESGDFLAKERPLPEVGRGDLMAVFAAGAYGMVMASTYNAQPLPAEVMVEGSQARLIRPRQSVDDLLAPERACLPADGSA